MHVCCSWVKGERKGVFQRGCGRTQGCGDFRARRITSFSKDMRFDLRVLTRPDFWRQVGAPTRPYVSTIFLAPEERNKSFEQIPLRRVGLIIWRWAFV